MRSGALPRVGYLGPEGTFSQEALLASASRGAVEPVPLASSASWLKVPSGPR